MEKAEAGFRQKVLLAYRGQVLRLVHVVRAQQDRLAERGEVLDDLPRLVPGRGVEPRRGLVEEQQVRVAGQGDGDVQPPLLPPSG
jgi:hypothetical protein